MSYILQTVLESYTPLSEDICGLSNIIKQSRAMTALLNNVKLCLSTYVYMYVSVNRKLMLVCKI